MIPEPRGGNGPEGGGLAVLTVLALIVGAVSGVAVALFIIVLERADRLRDAFVGWAHAQGSVGFWFLVIAFAAAAAAAASLVRRISPQAVGSGIPHVEA